MIKLEVMFVVLLKTIVVAAFSKSADTAMFHQTNDKILDILDDLFIALKIGQNFTKSKIVEEYMSKHSLIQDALCNNHVKYKEIHDISKTNISHKTAYYISNINEVVDEMIRTENVKKPSSIPNSNSTLDESQNLVNLARIYNLNIKTIATPTPKLPTTKGSQGEARRIFEDNYSDSTLDTKDSQDEVRRIFEGSSTGIKKYPFMVSVHVAGRFMCAGSLVHKSLVLSAASCLMRATDMNADIEIRVASDYVSRMGYLVSIQETIFHPEFNRTTLANNLVILRTRKALRFRKKHLVAIDYDRAAVSALKRNVQDVVILGWGQRKAVESVEAHLLEKDRPLSEAHVQLYNFRDCRYIYTRDFVGDNTFCAGFIDRGAGACNHDSGGPALIANMLVGVISFGSPKCGATEAPTVFTRVGVYDTWIDSILQKLNQNPEMPLQQSTNISKNIVRTEIMNLDGELKEVQKENFVADEVLNGPIEPLNDNEMPNLSHNNLQKFPSYPKEFPKQVSLNIPDPETLKSAELSDGYWRDYSIEETKEVTKYYRPAAKLGTTRTVASIALHQQVEKQYQAQAKNEIYKDNFKFAVKFTNPKEANLGGNYFDNKLNDIKINSKKVDIYEYALIKKNSTQKGLETSTDSVREKPNGNDNAQTKLIETENQQFLMSQPTGDEIARTGSNQRAVIVLVDSGTTQRIYLHNNDPVYQRGFKILADKVRQAQALV